MSRVIHQIKRFVAGQGMVEMALVLPILIVLMFGIMEFSYVLFRNASVSNATREAARKAGLNRYSRSQIKDFVTMNAPGVSISSSAVSITTNASDGAFPGNPPTVTVETNITHHFILGALFPFDTLTLKSEHKSIVVTYTPDYEDITF